MMLGIEQEDDLAPTTGRVRDPIWPWAILVLASFYLTYAIMTQTQLLTEPRVTVERYVAGTASKPFCFRALVPWLVRALGMCMPLSLTGSVCGQGSTLHLCSLLPTDPGARRFYLSFGLVLFLSIAAYGWKLQSMFRMTVGVSNMQAWCMTAVALLVHAAVLRVGGYGHAYDFTVLALFAAMLSALLADEIGVFALLFAVASWTKETAILMSFSFAIVYVDRLPRARLLTYLGLQLLLYAVAQGTVRWIFSGNAGAIVEPWYLEQIQWFLRKPIQRVAFFTLLGGVVFGRWSKRGVVLRRAAVMLVPHLCLFAYGGRPAEWRALYESFPVLFILSLGNVQDVLHYYSQKMRALHSGTA
jgi:hypothetical protein